MRGLDTGLRSHAHQLQALSAPRALRSWAWLSGPALLHLFLSWRRTRVILLHRFTLLVPSSHGRLSPLSTTGALLTRLHWPRHSRPPILRLSFCLRLWLPACTQLRVSARSDSPSSALTPPPAATSNPQPRDQEAASPVGTQRTTTQSRPGPACLPVLSPIHLPRIPSQEQFAPES